MSLIATSMSTSLVRRRPKIRQYFGFIQNSRVRVGPGLQSVAFRPSGHDTAEQFPAQALFRTNCIQPAIEQRYTSNPRGARRVTNESFMDALLLLALWAFKRKSDPGEAVHPLPPTRLLYSIVLTDDLTPAQQKEAAEESPQGLPACRHTRPSWASPAQPIRSPRPRSHPGPHHGRTTVAMKVPDTLAHPARHTVGKLLDMATPSNVYGSNQHHRKDNCIRYHSFLN